VASFDGGLLVGVTPQFQPGWQINLGAPCDSLAFFCGKHVRNQRRPSQEMAGFSQAKRSTLPARWSCLSHENGNSSSNSAVPADLLPDPAQDHKGRQPQD
jgi:hypothetical protein